MFETASVLIVMAAFFGYINHHTLKLPFAIGITIGGLLSSGFVLLFDALFPGWGLGAAVLSAVEGVAFPTALLNGMLSFLLFAGALHVDLSQLRARARSIFTLASAGLLLSTFLVGFGAYLVFQVAGLDIALVYCLVFGALISPTDPVAVLGIMRAAGAPEEQEVTIVGESLFNDGVGVVVFLVLSAFAFHTGHGGTSGGDITMVLLEEVGGGLVLGLGAGLVIYLAMRSLNEPHLEVLMSVALVMGITSLALRLHFSAPLACVVAGLFIGNHGRMYAMSDATRETLDLVWEFIDELLNAVLFLLVGLEVVALSGLSLTTNTIAASLVLVFVTLGARFVSVSIPIAMFKKSEGFGSGTIRVLTWGGLKGGISVALALSLPEFEGRAAILTATYLVVIFSIIVQGLTVGKLVKRIQRRRAASTGG